MNNGRQNAFRMEDELSIPLTCYVLVGDRVDFERAGRVLVSSVANRCTTANGWVHGRHF